MPQFSFEPPTAVFEQAPPAVHAMPAPVATAALPTVQYEVQVI
jgi:hypothetical protein